MMHHSARPAPVHPRGWTLGSRQPHAVRPFSLALVPICLAGLLLTVHSSLAVELEQLLSTRAFIRAERLREHVQTLADDTLEGREAGTRGGRAAGGYVLQEFEKSLAAAGGRLEVQSFGTGYRNILGVLDGSDSQLRGEYVLIGAHYDHVGFGTVQNSYGPLGLIHNGADDNASGTAAILMLLEALSQTELRPSRSVVFALWDAEEKGLLGSKYWIDHPTVPLSQLRLVINLDMIGRLRDQQVDVYGTRSMANLRGLISRANRDPGLRLNFLWKIEPNGDHYSFFSRRIPVVMFHTGLHDQYHRPSDDVEWINSAGLGTVAELVFGTLVEATEAPLGSFRSEAPQEGEAARKTFERPLASLPPRLGISWRTEPGAAPGLQVTAVRLGSPADRAGIRVGDSIRKFADQVITDTASLQRAVVRAPSDVALEIQRGDESLTLSVSLDGTPSRLGLSWRTNSAEPGTVTVIRVVPHSPADRAGLKLADRIHQIGGKSFADSRTFAELAHSLPLPLDLLIERNGRFQSIKLPDEPIALHTPDEQTTPAPADQEPSDSAASGSAPEPASSDGNPELR